MGEHPLTGRPCEQIRMRHCSMRAGTARIEQARNSIRCRNARHPAGRQRSPRVASLRAPPEGSAGMPMPLGRPIDGGQAQQAGS